jgi:choline dehydrogenase-like flavoprotein
VTVKTDPWSRASAAGWKLLDATSLEQDRTLECDVAIVGSGAGGGVTAEILAQAGLAVVILEEGPLATSIEFRMREHEAYPRLYQESAARQTLDKSITLLQGRCVGGGTTVNWTTSLRTPPRTLAHWRTAYGLQGLTDEAMAPWFARMEARLAIAPWSTPPNANNDALRRGAAKLGIASNAVRRNVKGCANLGYCGLGCAMDAKQSMLVTTIPTALQAGAMLVHRARVTALQQDGDRIVALEAHGVGANGSTPLSPRLQVRARHYVLAAGAIGTPALLLASRVTDPRRLVGGRTFLHPTVVSAALMPGPVNAWAGAPQSVYVDHFLEPAAEGPVGFMLEVPPVHPVLAAITMPGYGREHAQWMSQLANTQVTIAFLRDGFHADSPGGQVARRRDGWPVLDYAMTPYLWEGVRRAWLTMAELQFAAGATRVMTLHEDAHPATSWRDAKASIESLPLKPLAARILSAHAMGGCPMGPDERAAVVNADGRHHHLANLSVHDGSVFPTSVGANPQLSIYALAARWSAALAASLRTPA